ncbi:hypothetical protein A2799_01870 [Candidatus Roizmanbacteria bacterium RIFCSPHIGHO2_01_FULL_39_24]|uniref:Uncharacterized protein n=1 Tax=Candidatus Roizmanbacteria bacterium RIFCSPHIGHO2_01_FULL_39_24 TaxID=1802032 RepID=A0A1F7GFQ3_9BACT|nr:MAG: hypothetical protein A2799_01870 [Candidatus Roizmanbacteria bacterium RIFCSPHIGHO2_01_FULL_39_24]OGK49602.1 MAG: hypothetical protein A3A56_03425 [Candidatus Roizmanbacteria bacterium RIFCSPLOWO2_01_FULL_40_32]
MEQHPIPRQITTFEFKLIGFLTLKQFIYLTIFAAFATIAFFSTDIEIFKWLGAGIVFGIGLFFAFFKYNDRSIDVWIKNLVTKLFSSSQYFYHKKNEPPTFLIDIAQADNSRAATHVDAQKKLSSYLEKIGIHEKVEEPAPLPETPIVDEPEEAPVTETKPVEVVIEPDAETPYLFGVVKNHKGSPLPNILIYIHDSSEKVVRILKTNHAGAFATFKPLVDENYLLQTKDPGEKFFFDTMKLDVTGPVKNPIIIISRELL